MSSPRKNGGDSPRKRGLAHASTVAISDGDSPKRAALEKSSTVALTDRRKSMAISADPRRKSVALSHMTRRKSIAIRKQQSNFIADSDTYGRRSDMLDSSVLKRSFWNEVRICYRAKEEQKPCVTLADRMKQSFEAVHAAVRIVSLRAKTAQVFWGYLEKRRKREAKAAKAARTAAHLAATGKADSSDSGLSDSDEDAVAGKDNSSEDEVVREVREPVAVQVFTQLQSALSSTGLGDEVNAYASRLLAMLAVLQERLGSSLDDSETLSSSILQVKAEVAVTIDVFKRKLAEDLTHHSEGHLPPETIAILEKFKEELNGPVGKRKVTMMFTDPEVITYKVPKKKKGNQRKLGRINTKSHSANRRASKEDAPVDLSPDDFMASLQADIKKEEEDEQKAIGRVHGHVAARRQGVSVKMTGKSAEAQRGNEVHPKALGVSFRSEEDDTAQQEQIQVAVDAQLTLPGGQPSAATGPEEDVGAADGKDEEPRASPLPSIAGVELHQLATIFLDETPATTMEEHLEEVDVAANMKTNKRESMTSFGEDSSSDSKQADSSRSSPSPKPPSPQPGSTFKQAPPPVAPAAPGRRASLGQESNNLPKILPQPARRASKADFFQELFGHEMHAKEIKNALHAKDIKERRSSQPLAVLGRPPIIADLYDTFERELEAATRPMRRGDKFEANALLHTLHDQSVSHRSRASVESVCLARVSTSSTRRVAVYPSLDTGPDGQPCGPRKDHPLEPNSSSQRFAGRSPWQNLSSSAPGTTKDSPLMPSLGPTKTHHLSKVGKAGSHTDHKQIASAQQAHTDRDHTWTWSWTKQLSRDLGSTSQYRCI